MFFFGRIFISIVMMCVLLTGCANARKVYMTENLQLGRLTFESGDFKKAFCQLLPLAVEGSPQAQYAVGYMYYYGYGAPMDRVSGMFWIKRSADQYYPPAVKALVIIKKCEENEKALFKPTPLATEHHANPKSQD